jgi:transmembrane sensor
LSIVIKYYFEKNGINYQVLCFTLNKQKLNMDYSSFKAEEFSKDVDFIAWVLSPTEDSNQFWNTYIANNSNKLKEIQLAKEYIETLHFQEIEVSDDDINRLKDRIWNDIEQAPVIRLKWWKRPASWAAAASIVLVGFTMFWFNQKSVNYETGYGQIRKIDLADGSVVTLNANSKLKIEDDLGNTPLREVWLEGEAYFDIAKKNGAKFIVHTSEAEVEVLGTEFNVNTRRKQTKVILHEGKVKLLAGNAQPVIMKPGEMATVLNNFQPIQLTMVKPEQYDVWKESLAILNDKTVLEIAEMLEDTYGVTLTFEDSLMLHKKLSGKLVIKSTDDFVDNLATILDVKVQKTEKGYILKHY